MRRTPASMHRARRSIRRPRTGLGPLLLAAVSLAAAADRAADVSDEALLARLTQLRGTFLKRADEEGYRLCPAPAIELGDPPAFGHYEADRNTVVIASYAHPSDPRQLQLEDLAQRRGAGAGAQPQLEADTLAWVFIHELGHWWQACRGLVRPGSYGAENGANRIALAFWGERDPRLRADVVQGARQLVSSLPSPVPVGQTPQKYLDENLLKATQPPGDSWYQAQMLVELAAEVPPPSFHRALSQPLYPW